MSATVVVTSRSFSSGRRDLVAELADAGLTVVRAGADHDLNQLGTVLPDAVAWIAGTGPVTSAHLDLAPGLKIVARYGVGYDAVDLAAADERGVLVTNTPGANSEAVAEHTIALLFAALRGIAAGDARVRGGDWSVSRGRQLSGSRVGVVGFGRIGRGTAAKLSALGCTVAAHDPYVDDDAMAAIGAESVALEGIADQDIVVLHAPGGRRLIDADYLQRCAPGQVIVNTARADLIDEAAVAAALTDGRLAGYAADTLQAEAGHGADSPLLDPALAAQVTITPHLGAQTTEAVDLMGSMATDDVIAVVAGRPPRHPVQP